jgi:hypothetical protein
MGMLIKSVLALALAFQASANTLNVQRGKPVHLNVYASDNTFIDRVEYYLDNTLIGTVPGAKNSAPNVETRYALLWSAPKKKGSHALKVTVYDAAGNRTSRYATVVVQ